MYFLKNTNMKILILIISIFLITFAPTVFSQNIEFIDEHCGKINSNISGNENDLNYYFIQKLNYISNFRAIGRQDTKIIFYYPPPVDEYHEENNETKFNVIYLLPEKVKINYNIAASMDINTEYYYQNGHLLLYHSVSRGAYYCIEEKYYFNGKGELLKIETKKPSGCPQEDVLEEKPVYVKESEFNEEENKIADKIQNNAGKYIDLFLSLVIVEGIEK